jgi:hypothetical protein
LPKISLRCGTAETEISFRFWSNLPQRLRAGAATAQWWTLISRTPTLIRDGGYVFINDHQPRVRHHTPQKNGDETMIITTISFRAAPGKNLEAVEYLQKIARDVKKLTGTDVRVATQLAGPAGHYIVSSSYDSVAKWDESRQKTASDASLQKAVVDAGKNGLFIPGSVTSALWQEL